MHKIPLNHKTIFVLDHSGHFALSSEQPIEFDAPVKPKAATSAAAAPPPTQKLNPLTKCLWSCNIEALLEFSRIVYDLHPQDKLIRLMVTKFDIPLNSWLPNEQGLEHISMLMGSVPAPTVQLKPSYEGEDMVNLCKALNIAVGLIAQMSPMQISLAQQQQAKAAASSISGTPTKSNAEIVPNTGRIVLFTSSRARDLDQIQEFMEKAIEKCNKDIEAAFRNEQLTDSLSLLKINLIELVLIDIVNCKQNLTFEKDIFKQNSSELRTHILSSKSGNHLSYKMIELSQKFYDLAITSVTNIPMKEELNASSSANYDVDILHSKALHDQLKICGLYKNCLLKKDAPNTVCLKWSNPKTNITEFNFSNNSFRITPIDVNSRPASCLTSFLLGGRCVLLEVPQGRVFPAANTNRVQSHVLYNQGNEIFMHGLNFSVKSHLDDKLERFSIDDSAERIKDFRINEFVDLMRAHKLTQTQNENESFNAQKALHRLEKATRKWPIKYSSTLITNLIQLKPLVKSVTEESINDIQYNECIKCIEYYQSGEHKNEPITSANLLAAPSAEQLALLGKPRKDVYKRIWLELESMLKYYQDVSERHRILYSHVRNMLISTLRNESLIKARASGVTTNPANVHAAASQAKNDEIANQIENEKLGRKRKINKDLISANEEINLLDMWLRSQNEAHKSRLEFYGRVAYPNQIAQLYTHLKLDELPASKLTGAKIDM